MNVDIARDVSTFAAFRGLPASAEIVRATSSCAAAEVAGDADEDLGALVGRQRLAHRRLCRVDRAARLRRPGLCDPADELTRVRRAHLQPVARLDPLSVDQEFPLGGCCRHGPSLRDGATARLRHVLDIPDVKYARAGGVAVAYQVVSEGPRRLTLTPFLTNLYSIWQLPALRRFFGQLAAETGLVVINPRGIGLSDRPRIVTIEGWMDDVRSVLDAEGIERTSLFGTVDSANASLLLAATYPELVERLVILSPVPRFVNDEDYRLGSSLQEALAGVQTTRERWNERDYMTDLAQRLNPDWADDPEYVEWFVWNHRITASPGTAAEFRRMQLSSDVTDILAAVRVPTLVLHRAHDRAAAEYVARRIPSSSLLEIPGRNFSPAHDAIAEATLAFVRGEAPQMVSDAVLATVLFTDLVGSTTRAAELGDRLWRDVLARHHDAVRREVARFRGTVLDTAGDGFFCRFDGPARAIACAREIVSGAPALGLAVRAGLHTGECEVSGEKLVGLSVVIGARVAALAEAGDVLVSSTVKDLVAGSGLEFEDRGEHELKGVPGAVAALCCRRCLATR